MSEAEGEGQIRMRSGVWTWEPADPAPELELDHPHVRLVDVNEPENEMRVPLDPAELEEEDPHAIERAAARPVVRLWLDRQGTLWAVWPPDEAEPAVQGPRLRSGAPISRDLTFVSEDWSYDTPAPRPLGELKGSELQELLDAEREAEAGVEEEWIGDGW